MSLRMEGAAISRDARVASPRGAEAALQAQRRRAPIVDGLEQQPTCAVRSLPGGGAAGVSNEPADAAPSSTGCRKASPRDPLKRLGVPNARRSCAGWIS